LIWFIKIKNYDTVGIIIGYLDNHNIFREFEYHDHSEFYDKYNNIKLIDKK